MIIEVPNFIPDENIEYILRHCHKYLQTNNYNKVAYNRDGHTIVISEEPELKELDQKIHEIMGNIHKVIVSPRYDPQFLSGDTGYEYHRYNPGDMCHYHSDREVMNNKLRYASVVIHLSTNNDGGELIFPGHNKKIKTEKGKVVVFPPYGCFGHYVTPSSTPREVIVSWFVYQGITINT